MVSVSHPGTPDRKVIEAPDGVYVSLDDCYYHIKKDRDGGIVIYKHRMNAVSETISVIPHSSNIVVIK